MNSKATWMGFLPGAVGLAAVALLLASAGVDAEAGAAPVKAAKATFIKGDVTAGEGDKLTRLKRGGEVKPGWVVKTGDNARAELTFADGSVVRIAPGSELKVQGSTFNGKSKEVKVEAELVAGKAWAKVSKLVGEESGFQVKTNNAVAGVRGTIFRINIEKDEATVVKVYNGAVAVAAPLLTDEAKKDPGNPIDPNRRPLEAPPFQQVSIVDFEHLLGKMMQVRVGAAGVKAAVPEPFTAEDDSKGEPEWVRWNADRDAGKSTEKSE